MVRREFKVIMLSMLVLLSLFLIGQSVWAVTPQQLQAVAGKGKTVEVDKGEDVQIPPHLDSQQVDAYLATLSDTQARQVLAQKLKEEAAEPLPPAPASGNLVPFLQM
jgi:hypothetical protein